MKKYLWLIFPTVLFAIFLAILIISKQRLTTQSKASVGKSEYIPTLRPQFVPGELLIQYASSNTPESIKALASSDKFEKIASAFKKPKNSKKGFPENVYKITLKKGVNETEALDEVKKESQVVYAERNAIMYPDAIQALPNDPYFLDSYPNSVANRDPVWNPPHDYQWNIKMINASEGYLINATATPVAVIDTGLDVNQPELGNVWVNANEIPDNSIDDDQNGCIDDINGCNIMLGNGAIGDDVNHGTHVAGVISAKTNNGMGLAGISGNIPVMGIKVFDATGYSNGELIASGILYAVNNGARVINMSLGGSQSQTMQNAIDYAISNGVIVVVSAGNGNKYSASNGYFPASYKPVITVGAVDEFGHKLKYSNYGPNIDVFAPGGGSPCWYWEKPSYCSNILSLKSSQNTNDPELVVNTNYLRLSGTSMAAPHVAGIAALLLTQHPQWTQSNIESYIMFNSLSTNELGHTENGGWGIINLTGSDFTPPSAVAFTVVEPAENQLVGTNFSVHGEIRATNFTSFTVQYRQKGTQTWQTTGVTLVSGGNQQIIPVYNGIAKIADITLPADSPRTDYEIRTNLAMSSGKTLATTKTVRLAQKLGTSQPIGENGSVLISDINNDGNKEIILYNTNGMTKVFDKNYNLLWSVPVAGETVVGDIDKRNTTQEVVIQTATQIQIYNSQGNAVSDMWLNIRSDQQKNIVIADLDGNGTNELCFHEKYYTTRNAVHCFEQNNSFQFVEKWQRSTSTTQYVNFAYPVVGDLLGDGKKEIISRGTSGLEVINDAGQVVASTPDTWDGMVTADMDLDGKQEIILHTQWGPTKMLKLVNGSLQTVWTFNNSNNLYQLSIGNFNSDPYPEIFIAVNNLYSFTILDHTGQVLKDTFSILYYPSNTNFGTPIVDKDNNGKTDIVTTGYYNYDHRDYFLNQEYDPTSSTVDLENNVWRVGISSNISVDDLDNNGKLDIVSGDGKIMEYQTSGTVYWSQRYHDAQRTFSYTPVIVNPASPTPTPSLTPTVTPTNTPSPTLTVTPTPSPTCIPRPSCLDAKPFPCKIVDRGFCPPPKLTPTPTCIPRPACLDAKPPCKIVDRGFCPAITKPPIKALPRITTAL